jgi:hypothetical protein
VNAAALLKLADLLESLPPERFDYCMWAGSDWSPESGLSCGTTACALGWATTIPELGLELRRGEVLNCYVSRVGQVAHHPASEGPHSLECAADVFDVSLEEATFLFCADEIDPRLGSRGDDDDQKYDQEYLDGELSPSDEASAKEVAVHIRRFVKSREGTP